MGDELRLKSYNCRSLKNSLNSIRLICETSDLVFLQETWLAKFELSVLHNIHAEFIGYGVSAFDSKEALLSGRPYGGIAVLFRKSLQSRITVRTISERVMAADIATAIGQVCLLNVYLPTDYRDDDSLEEFGMTIGQVECEIASAANNASYYGIIEDFNADAKGSRFFTELSDFCEDNNLVISDVQHLSTSSNVFTFYSQAHLSTSWLDHCVLSHHLHSRITELSIDYSIIESDHFPLCIHLGVPLSGDISNADSRNGQTSNADRLKWDKATREHLENYNDTVALKF